MRAILAVSLGWLGISMVSDGVPALLLPYQLIATGRSDATTLGLTTLVGIALAAGVQPIAGRWSDTVGRLPVMALGVVVATAGLVLLVVPDAALVGAVVALVGVSIAQAGYQPLIPDHVPARQRGRAAGAKGACDVGGAFVGFLVIAALLGAGAPLVAALVLAAALGGSILATHLLLPRREQRRSSRESSLMDAYRVDLSAHRALLTLVVARFLFLLGIYVVGRFLLLFIADRFGATPEAAGEQAGLVLALLALLTMVASPPSGWLADRLGRRWLMIGGAALGGAGIALLPSASSEGSLLVFGSLMALGSAAFSAGSWALLTDLAPPEDAGRLLGIANFGTAGAAALAGAFGLLIDAGNQVAPGSGYLLAFEISAVSALLGGAVAWRAAAPSAAARRAGIAG